MLSEHQSTNLLFLSGRVARREITQLDLSRATGVHQSQISRILSGQARRSSENLRKLCEYAESLRSNGARDSDCPDGLINALKPLLGKSAAEEKALVKLVISLGVWRASWSSQS